MTSSPLTVAVGIYGPPAWTIDSRHVDALRARFPDVRFLHANSDEEFDAAMRDADVVFSSVVREKAFAGARRLRWVHASAAGVGSTLFPAFVDSDVVLTNSRGLMSDWIAEHVLALVLAWRRRIPTALRRQALRQWAQDEVAPLQPPALEATRALIVGMGSIGRATAALLRATGMLVEGVGRVPRDGWPGVDSLPALLPAADVVAITAPHTKETDRLFGRDLLTRMKPGSLIVNVGRGRIIDEAALIDALGMGRPGAAALDVFEREPLSRDSPLWEMENVLITPHVAGFGPRFWEGMIELFAANLERWQRGEPLENVVDKRRGY